MQCCIIIIPRDFLSFPKNNYNINKVQNCNKSYDTAVYTFYMNMHTISVNMDKKYLEFGVI